MEFSYVGIDMAKRSFSVALLIGEKVRNKSCDNSESGFNALKAWLERQPVENAHICMEATGTYHEKLAEFLVNNGYVVSVINPARIASFSQSLLTRTKSDKSDAVLIARFCQAMRPEPWTPPAPEVKELQALVRRVDDLKEMLQMEENRLEAGTNSPVVKDSLKTSIARLKDEIAKTEELIKKHIDRHPGLKDQQQLLTSIPGIAERTATVILGELGDLSRFSSARELAAHCGLTPKERTSGSSVRGKPMLSKVGNARVRCALYLPAVVAKNCNPTIQAFCQRLLEKGKPKMAVIGAAMRKLLHIAFGVLKHRRPYDPNYAT